MNYFVGCLRNISRYIYRKVVPIRSMSFILVFAGNIIILSPVFGEFFRWIVYRCN